MLEDEKKDTHKQNEGMISTNNFRLFNRNQKKQQCKVQNKERITEERPPLPMLQPNILLRKS